MKVLLVSRRYYPEFTGGGQISAHHIAQALVKAGHELRVLTFLTEGPRKDEVIDGVPVTRLPIRTLRFFPRISNLEWMYREMELKTLKFLDEFRPDVIHALNGESVPSIAKVSRKTGIPFVATINGPTLFCFTQEGVDSQGKNCIGCKGVQRFRETMLKWGGNSVVSKLKAFAYWLYSYPHMAVFDRALRHADMLLPVSTGFRQRLIEIGYPPNKLTVVHNPINVHTKMKSNLKKKLGIGVKDKTLFFAGRITQNKGIQNMVRVLESLPNAHVVVAGKGDYVEPLLQLAAQLNVKDRVHFVGLIANEKLGEYYSIADVVIMAGTFYEALGRMLLEACSFGVPVIATNSAGNPDIIEHGKNGYLIENPNADELLDRIKNILDNPAKAEKMGTCGKQKISREFSPERIASELTAVYEHTLQKHL